jgi:hypothetical protein
MSLAACSQAPEAAPSSSGPDCTLARTAMDDYGVALTDLATSLAAGDPMSAVAAADGMSYALDQLEQALPAIPADGQAFLTASRAVALQVKQAAADSSETPDGGGIAGPSGMTGLIDELTATFAEPAFAEGGAAIDAYADQLCPEATSESANPTPSGPSPSGPSATP